MKAVRERKAKSDTELVDQATGSLLKAGKQRMIKKQGRVDYPKLRKDGYSYRFLARLDDA